MTAKRHFGYAQGGLSAAALQKGSGDLQRDVAVFFARVGVAFVFEGAQGGDDFRAGLRRGDDGVNVAALGGDVGIGEALAELGDFFLAEFFALAFGRLIEFALIDDVDGAFRTHDGDFRGGPGKVGVGADVFAGHDAVRAAVGLAGDDRDFRHGGFSEGEEQLGAVLDDSAELLLRAGKKSGHIFKGDERNVERVAEAHKARALHRSIDVQTPGEHGGLIGHDAHGTAVEARKSHDNVFGEVFVDFEEIVVVHHGVNGVLDVVGLHGVFGDKRIERGVGAVGRVV